MTYSTDDMELQVIATCLAGSVNDVVVCRNLRSSIDERYTLLVVHDRSCVKELLAILDSAGTERPYLFCFAQNEAMIFAFPYRTERKFSTFAHGQILTPSTGEAICVNLIMACISSHFPPPLLYLILTQDNLHITKENDIYFSQILDLSLLDASKTETDCTVRCAEIIIELLGSVTKKRLRSHELVRRKCRNRSYSYFTELYRDIRLTAIPEKQLGIKDRLRGLWLRSRDKLFRLLLVICVFAAVAALIMLISQIVSGDIPLLRLFKHCFDIIGTEHLN